MLCTNITNAQTIFIPHASTPIIDGTLSSGEWEGADTISISILGGAQEVKVLFMHDSANLHFAYLGNLESVSARYPEVLLDIDNDKSSSWEDDDWWFHVSATDCEYQGQHSNYDSCMAVRPNWTANSNFAAGPPITDTVEIQIPFATIGLDINTVDTIGISLEVTNTFSAWEHWPSSAVLGDPSTWANAVFRQENVTGIDELERGELKVYPNPSDGRFTIEFPHSHSSSRDISIVDIRGREVFNESFIGDIPVVIEMQVDPGFYFLREGNVTGFAQLVVR